MEHSLTPDVSSPGQQPGLTVSFIVPVKGVNAYVCETLTALIEQGDDLTWEVWVVTNEPEPSPFSDPRIRMLASGRQGPGAKRDLAAKHARGTWLVFLDDDSAPAPGYFSGLQLLTSRGIIAFGGPGVTPPSATFGERVSGAFYSSKLLGGSPWRYRPLGRAKLFKDWPTVNLGIQKTAFESVGGFDCAFWPGEDTFLCDKLDSANINIHYEPRLIVWHHRRDSLSSHLKQVGAYGLHRGFFARRFGASSRRFTYFIPSLLIVALSTSVALAALQPELLTLPVALLVFYGLIVLAGSIETLRWERPSVAVGLLLFAPASHSWYGVRFVQGLLFKRNLVSTLR